MVVEAKHVRDREKCSTPRTLDNYIKAMPWHAGTHQDDEEELDKYKAAMAYPGNDGQIRGIEVCTNTRDSTEYWQALMDDREVRGYAREVP